MDTKVCDQLMSNDTNFDDIWFSGVKTSEEGIIEGVDYFGPVKTSHKSFCLATLEKLVEEWPGGSYLVMNINPIFPCDIPLMDIILNYNYSKFIGFIATGGGWKYQTRLYLFISLT